MNTRHGAYTFDLPRVTGEEKGTFYYNAIKDWNGLPDGLRVCSNLMSFKSKLKQYCICKRLQSVGQKTNTLYFINLI